MPQSDCDIILADARALCDAYLGEIIPSEDQEPQRLHAAMRYAVFAGGKRLRPALALAVNRCLGGSDEACLPIMAAIEMLHTYTLVHDDLPAMDDDDMRRGQPACHKAFDEATAILCGDALLTLSMGCIAQHSARAVQFLSHACGSIGVVGGQQDDLDAENHELGPDSEALLMRIHERKTAALISVSCGLGALSADASDQDIAAFGEFGQHIGISFQMTDDLLDHTASSEDIGKTAGKDADQNKLTSLRVFGVDGTRERAAAHISAAQDVLAGFGDSANTLRGLADFIVNRNT